MSHHPAIPTAPTRNGHLPPDNHAPLVGWALLLCLPLGLVALHHSRRVKRCWLAGERQEARMASQAALRWAVRAYLVPTLLFVLFMLYWGCVSAQQKFAPQNAWTEQEEALHPAGEEEDEGDESVGGGEQ